MNEFAGRIEGALFRGEDGLEIRAGSSAAGAGRAWLLVRPEQIRVSATSLALANRFPATVERVTFLGNVADIHLRLDGAQRALVAQLHGDGPAFAPGAAVEIGWAAEHCVVGALDESDATLAGAARSGSSCCRSRR